MSQSIMLSDTVFIWFSATARTMVRVPVQERIGADSMAVPRLALGPELRTCFRVSLWFRLVSGDADDIGEGSIFYRILLSRSIPRVVGGLVFFRVPT